MAEARQTKEDTGTLWRQYVRTKDQRLRYWLILNYAPLVKYVAGRPRKRAARPTSTRATSSRTGCSV